MCHIWQAPYPRIDPTNTMQFSRRQFLLCWHQRPRLRLLIMALLLSVVMAMLSHARGWQDLELKGFDLLTSSTAPRQSRLPIVLVGIDDASLAHLQQRWPWPRTLHAQLIDALSSAGAALIAFDVLFEYPTDDTEDQALADSIKKAGNVVLASAMVQQETSHGTAWIRKEPLPLFAAVGARSGLVNILYDRDQTLRRIPDNTDAFWREISTQLSIRLPDLPQTTEPPEGSLIRYTGPSGTYPRISFYQALEPDRYLPPGELKDALVLIGRDTRSASDIGAAQVDTFATPFTLTGAPHMPGMEVHANILENVLGTTTIQTVPAGISAAITTLCLLATAMLQRQFRPVRAAAFSAAQGLLVCALAWLLFTQSHWWLPVFGTLCGITGMYVMQTLAAYLMEREQRMAIRGMFSRYVPAAVVNTLTAHPEKLTLGGENRELSLLFTDLAGFTSISESLDPRRAADLLNRYFTAMNQVIFDYGGTIDKFIGDSVMAFWNAPLEDPAHAMHAAQAACAMQNAMATLNAELQAEGLPELHMRIGVHTGQALVGNIGSAIGRLSYTAIGDTVNLASRLEGANKAYGTNILLSESTAQQLQGEIALRAVDRVRVKGKSHAVDILTPCSDAAVAQASNAAIEAFRRADRNACEIHLKELEELCPNDTLATLYRTRIGSWNRIPPSPDWDGSWTLDSK